MRNERAAKKAEGSPLPDLERRQVPANVLYRLRSGVLHRLGGARRERRRREPGERYRSEAAHARKELAPAGNIGIILWKFMASDEAIVCVHEHPYLDDGTESRAGRHAADARQGERGRNVPGWREALLYCTLSTTSRV